jgi:putative ABC transport system substrate-binding protein
MITRRRFVAWAGSSALALGTARSQQKARLLRIGFLTGSGDTPQVRSNLAGLERGLRELGYVEAKSPIWEKRFARGHYEELPSLLAELIRAKPDVIVVAGGTATAVARKAISDVPLVMVVSADPIASGLVSNLAHPGGNLTGVTSSAGGSGAKTLEFLLDLSPRVRRAGYLLNPDNPTFNDSAIQRMADDLKRVRNVDVIRFRARTESDVVNVFQQMNKSRIDGLIVPPDSFFEQQHRQIAELAITHNLPSTGGLLSYAASGGLGAYGANYPQLYYQAASYVDKIARGAKPGDLAVSMENVLEFWVNQRTAGLLGVPISETVLLRANKILQ